MHHILLCTFNILCSKITVSIFIKRGIIISQSIIFHHIFNSYQNSFINIQMEDQPQRQYANDYEIHLLLGEGGQANVYLGSKNNELHALKVYAPGQNKEEAFKIEADFLGKMKHPNLINMIDHCLQAKIKLNNRPEEKRPLLVLEFAEGGELFEYLSKTGKFTPELARTYTKQLIDALKYLIQIGVTHRDLKPENILFNKSFNLKVSDFGLARQAKGNKGDFKLSSRVGTEGYKPPEMELGQYQGLQADIFAIGVILFIMYNGTPPFISTKSHDKIYKLIKDKNFAKFWQLHERNKQPGYFSDSFKRLINSFLSAEPNRRPTFQTLESDDWMNGDILMNNELQSQMRQRADKLLAKDEVKRKIAEVKKQMFNQKLKEMEDQDCRGDFEEGSESVSLEEAFAHNFYNLNIQTSDLPEYTKNKVVYSDSKPAYIVAWIKNFFRENFKANNTFVTGFAEQIKFVKYSVDFIQPKNQVQICLTFELDEEDEVELQLEGKLHRSENGKVGVEWEQAKGNSFWLNLIECQLNQQLKTL